MSSDSTTAPADRTAPDPHADELDLLVQFLDYHRATIVGKCEGLDDDQLRTASAPPSNLTLLGLLRHLTDVERQWWVRVLDGGAAPPLYYSEDDPDGDFDSLESASVAQVRARYRDQLAESRRVLATFADGGEVARRTTGFRPSLRWVLVHLVEEYARHNGHADVIRQALDGATGE